MKQISVLTGRFASMTTDEARQMAVDFAKLPKLPNGGLTE